MQLDPETPHSETLKEFKVEAREKVHPWRRYFARSTDYFLFQTAALLFYINRQCRFSDLDCGIDLLVNVLRYLSQPSLQIIFLIVASYMFAEAAFISIFGTTPGKWFFGLSIRSRSGGMPGFYTSLLRSLRVWFVGCAMNLPLIKYITMVLAYQQLYETGTTWWDRKSDTQVNAQPQINLLRLMLWLVLIYLLANTYLNPKLLVGLALPSAL
jgi:hypothetical protein